MESSEEWCADKLSQLLQEDLRISALNEIKEHITSLPQVEASRVANLLDLPLVFDCLNDSNTEQVDLACEVISLCMTNLNIGESTRRYDVPLERALNHPHTAVKVMALNEIHRNISKEETSSELCKRASLLNSIIRCIGDKDISVAKKASDVITVLGTFDVGLRKLTSSDTLFILKEVMNTSEVVRLRIYEVVVNISKDSELNFSSWKKTGLLNQLIDELDNNDVLLRMNIVELLTQLGISKHGFVFLEKSGVLNKLFFCLEDNDNPLTLQLSEPGILKFFGNIARWKPLELLSKYPKLYDRLFSNLESGDLIIVGVTLDTLGIIGLSNEGKFALDSTGNKISYGIKTIIKLLASLPTDVRIRALNCIENLLRVTNHKSEVTQITQKWYDLFCDDPMELILKYARNPFLEIKQAGLSILQAMSEQLWGQEIIRNTPGLLEFLLDRNVEVIKECKEIKYEIIKALSVSTVFDHPTLQRLERFVKEGPFYVQATVEVAVEGNDE